ncbi:MAG: hypothetical protein AAGG75_03820 [Bacteroidota bacterium]
MATDTNKRAIELLHTDPAALLAHFQPIVEATVARFIARGFFTPADKMDVVQTINTQMLERKLAKIKTHFNGSVYLSTYFGKVVYNSCLEIIRQQQRRPQTYGDELLRHHSESALNAYEALAIRDELLRYQAILRGLSRRRFKSELCLRLFARILLQRNHMAPPINTLPKEQAAVLIDTFCQPYEQLKDKEVYRKIIVLFNHHENRNGDSDSLRKWVTILVDRIIDLLNGDPPVAAYRRDSLKVLLQYYYEKEKEDL